MTRIICLCVVGLVSAGCAPDMGGRARRALLLGYEAYGRGDNQAALRYSSSFLTTHAYTDGAGEAHYLRGLAADRLGDRPTARADWMLALKRTRSDDVRAHVFLAFGDVAYESDNLPMAEKMYRKSLSLARQRREPAQHAWYRLGHVLQRRGRWRDADECFGRLIEHFGESDRATQARRRLHAGAWTIQAGAFARKSNADALARKLSRRGLAAATAPRHATGRDVHHIVSVGRYDTYEQAEQTLTAMVRRPTGAFISVTR